MNVNLGKTYCGKLANPTAAHNPRPFNTNQTFMVGCEGCKGAGIVQARGIVGQKGGANLNPLAPTASDYFNQSTSVGYGYKNGADNLKFAGSGYPKITQTTSINSCQGGGKRKHKRKTKRGVFKKHFMWNTKGKRYLAKTHKQHVKGSKLGHTHKNPKRKFKRGTKSKTHSGKDFETRKTSKRYRSKQLKKLTGKGTMLAPVFPFIGGRRKKRRSSRKKHGGNKSFITKAGKKYFNSRKHNKRRKRKTRKQRGGYKQFQSNVPLTRLMSIPNGPQGGTWPGQLANPPTFKVLNNCVDNYNHFSPSK